MAASREAFAIGGPCLFSPDLGRESRRFWQVIAAAHAGELGPTLEHVLLDTESLGATEDLAKFRFACSLLADLVNAGGQTWVRDSQLFATWPDWNGPEGRLAAQAAMMTARDMRPLTADEVSRVAPCFAPDLDGEQLGEVLAEAKFDLKAANMEHPSGASYNDAFGAALRYWSMPYRGRSGRMRRFVLTAEHRHLGPYPVVVGIVELGDEAPFCTWRDDLLGLSPASFVRWLDARRRLQPDVTEHVVSRLAAFRACVRATSDGRDLGNSSADVVYEQREALEKIARGRSLVLESQRELLKDRKRLAYALRLARGEVALRRVMNGGQLDDRDPDLAAGVRGVHDLLLPRLHMEVTVCGAVPPFSSGLVGKLLVSFLTHPSVVSSTLEAGGELIDWSFDSERLRPLMPEHGMLCVTTKGLYSSHAAIYNRAEAPGRKGPLRMRHLANTQGTTTTLLSQRTVRLARAVLERPGQQSARVSSVYGSGGAKRHRAIQGATIAVGLPASFPLAGIRRPVYGMTLVEDPAEVSWLGVEPKWAIERDIQPNRFAMNATELWRDRWLNKATARVTDYAVVPSLVRMLQTADQG